jgi:hypothetical protein
VLMRVVTAPVVHVDVGVGRAIALLLGMSALLGLRSTTVPIAPDLCCTPVTI